MSRFFIFNLVIAAVSIIHRDDEMSSCGPTIFVTNCHQPSPLTKIMLTNLVKAKWPLLNVCLIRKLFPQPPSRPSFKLAISRVLAGDVSLNPVPSCSNDRIKIETMNARSIKPKTFPFSEYVTSKNLDIVAVTETWLKHDEPKSTITDILPPGYSFFHEPLADQRGRRRCRHTSVWPIKNWYSSSAII